MKILVLANDNIGLYKFRKQLLEELIKKNEVFISLPNGDCIPLLQNIGCKFIDTYVDRRGINPITDLKLLLNYLSILRKVKPDLVITYTIKPNLYGGIVSRFLKVPYAMNITGLGTAFQNENLIKKLVCFLYKIASKKAKVVFFENKGNKEVFIQNKLIREEQAYQLNGAGVNLEDYPFTSYPDKEETRFLFIGRVMKEKGIDELFEVASKIKEEYSNVFFDIVGPMEDNYKDVLDDLASKGIIQYHGFQNDIKPFVEKSHCFVLPSYHEGMANTLLECASMGRPLITSNIHGCKEAINNNGFVCNVKDSEDLYLKVKEFINLSYEDKKQLGLNSRKHIEEVFDKKKVVEETIRRL